MASVDDLMSKYPIPNSNPSAPTASAPQSPSDALMKKYPLPEDQHSLGDKVQAGVEGFGNMATFGLLPALEAGHQAFMNSAKQVPGHIEGGYHEPEDQPYVDFPTAIARNSARHEMQSKEMPGPYYGGQLAGAGIGLLGAGTAAYKAGSVAAKELGKKIAEKGVGGLVGEAVRLAIYKKLFGGH